jgi:signal transduction histidine kinase
MGKHMKLKTLSLVALLASTGLLNAQTPAQTDPATLASESEAKAVATAKDPLTPELIVSKVNAAAAMLEKEGMAGIQKLQGKDSEFIFSGTYIWVQDSDTKMVMHPIKYKLNGKSMVDSADSNGKFFFTEITNIAKQKGSGWVDYMWPKPGEKAPSKKVSYAKAVTVEGKLLVLGCGVYGFSDEQIATLEK